MVRLINSGLSAVYAFALVMTMTLTARATEKAEESATATEKMELKTSVQAQAMSVTAEKLIAKWAMEKALQRPRELEVMKEPVADISKEGVAWPLVFPVATVTKRYRILGAILTRGVLADEGTRYRITADDPELGHGCGEEAFPCTIEFNDLVNQPYQEVPNGPWYVDKGEGIASFGEGPYSSPE